MEEQANKIQAVINTLQTMQIGAKAETMELLLACYHALAEVRDALKEPVRIEIGGGEPYGDDHAEQRNNG